MFGNDAENNTDVNDDAGADAYEQMQQGDQGNDNDDNGDDNGDGDDSGDPDPSKQKAEGDDADDELDFVYNGEVLASQAADDEDQEGDTDLVKHLRNQLREQRKELKGKGSSQQAAATQNLPEEIPAQPQLGDDGIDWDNDKHAAAMDEWLKTRDAITARNAQREQQTAQLQTKLKERQTFYQTERAKVLKVPGYERAEQVVAAEIPENLQLTLLMNSKKPAGAVLALGRNAALRKQLNEVSGDPVALGYLLAEIDKGAGFKPRSKSTAKGAPAVKTGATQTTIHGLEAAIEKARESGDYTTVLQLKDKLKAAKKAG